jgi:hypothetical protein
MREASFPGKPRGSQNACSFSQEFGYIHFFFPNWIVPDI